MTTHPAASIAAGIAGLIFWAGIALAVTASSTPAQIIGAELAMLAALVATLPALRRQHHHPADVLIIAPLSAVIIAASVAAIIAGFAGLVGLVSLLIA